MATIQDWGADPAALLLLYNTGDPAPSPQTVTTFFRDIIGTPEGAGYESFYLEIENSASWLNISGIDFPYHITATSLAEDIIYAINTTALVSGIYAATVTFKIFGTTDLGSTNLLLSWDYSVSLKVRGDAILIDPLLPWSINYYQGSDIPAPNTIDMDGTDWTVKSPPEFVLSADPAVTITQDLNGWSTATGTGPYTVSVTMADYWLTAALGTYQFFIYLNEDTLSARTQEIRIQVLEVIEWSFSPETLHFEGIKNNQEPEPQLLIIDSVPTFDVVAVPEWLTVTPLTGQNHVELTVVPQPTINTEPGNYSGTIDIERVVDTVTITESILITYDLIGFISTPYYPEQFAFTLDTNFIQFFTEFVDTFFRIKLTAIISEFYSDNTVTKEYYYKVPLFQQRQKMNVGRIVDRLMSRIKDININGAQYKPADVSLYITEIQRETDTVVREFYFNNIKFIAGLTPQHIINNMAFLNVNPAATRVTVNSFYFLNYLIPTGTFTLITKRNDTVISSEIIASGNDNIFTRKITFENFTHGDTITLQLKNSNNDLIEKKFFVFPKGKQSNHIIWEDEYKLKQSIEFTDSYRITQGINNITSNYYRNLLAVLEKIDSTKSADLIINTGWLSKSDQISITSLLSQKKAWLFFQDETVLDLVPVSKKIISVDSSRALINFEVQFKINFKDNAQAYSF